MCQMINSAVEASESSEVHSPAPSNSILTCSVFAPSLQVKRSQRTKGSISQLGCVLKTRKKHFNKDHNFVLHPISLLAVMPCSAHTCRPQEKPLRLSQKKPGGGKESIAE